MEPAALGRSIVEEARRLGFHRVGISPVEPARRHELYRDWLAAGRAAGMAYLATPEHVEARADVRELLPEARTIVAVALSYAAPDLVPDGRLRGTVARYARGVDYHIVLKGKLTRLAEHVARAIGGPVAARPCVDTAPLLERDEAERAGIGFVAKNTMLIAPGLGSYVLLGELLLGVDAGAAAADEPARKRCGSCRACLDACPTGAFVDAFVLDARRCISYLTIEHEGAIPAELRAAIGTRIFGCDVCQEVCPFNAGAPPPGDAALLSKGARHAAPELLPLLALGANQFRQFVKRTALRRIHREQLLRNVCIALGNAGDPAAIPALRQALVDRHPLVRAHAAWALGRLGDHATLAARLADEPDDAVRAELLTARGSV